MDRYAVTSITNSVIGEGDRIGTRSVFVAFSGCNLWSGEGHQRDVGEGICSRWCDADFRKGKPRGVFELLEEMDLAWPETEALHVNDGKAFGYRWCFLTGGEPTLQVNLPLIDALHAAGWLVAMETNGLDDSPACKATDYLVVSPKAGSPLRVRRAEELKVVLPGAPMGAAGWDEAALVALEEAGDWGAMFVMPQDPLLGEAPGLTALRASSDDTELLELGQQLLRRNAKACLDFVMSHPRWRFTAQVQKMLGLA